MSPQVVKAVKLYAPVVVLLFWAGLSALHVSLSAMALVVMAGAVVLHIRAEAEDGKGAKRGQ